jgi:hypothetical protein
VTLGLLPPGSAIHTVAAIAIAAAAPPPASKIQRRRGRLSAVSPSGLLSSSAAMELLSSIRETGAPTFDAPCPFTRSGRWTAA